MEKTQIKIAQLSDLHFLEEKTSLMQGSNPYNNLNSIVKNISPNEYDYMFLSGDISENGCTRSYELLQSILDGIQIPIYCIPGNHDNKDNMLSVLSNSSHIKICDRLSFSGWDILFLDTTVANETFGLLSKESLEKLRFNIEKSDAANICIVMHHHPYETGVARFDRVNLRNLADFQNIIQNTKVRLVTFGHVHNYYSMTLNSILYESAPAVSFQLKQKGADLVVENKYGFKELLFSATAVHSNCIWNHNEVLHH